MVARRLPHTFVQVGKFHEISAGLLIGGKDVREEQSLINAMNVLVATPGRLLQVRRVCGQRKCVCVKEKELMTSHTLV